MSTLLMRIAAPLQSWGISSKFEHKRGTENSPSKSGIVGMVAAALGRRRGEDLKDLNELLFGLRVDKEGSLLIDFHTSSNPNNKTLKYIGYRHYLADAVFLVGLEGDEDLLNKIHLALKSPYFPLFLGRRSCPPAGKVALGIRGGKSLEQALYEEPLQLSATETKRIFQNENASFIQRRIIVESRDRESIQSYSRDLALSFYDNNREYSFRGAYEKTIRIELQNNTDDLRVLGDYLNAPTSHDPME